MLLFLFGIELPILAVYVHEFGGVVGYYLQFETRAVLWNNAFVKECTL
jgi:hypothetical protein